MADEVQYRNAKRTDLPAIAGVFLAAFPESVRHYVGHPIGPRVIADAFAICLDAEQGAFLVATVDGKVAGYSFTPICFARVFRVAFTHGHILRMFWRWITHQYGVGLRPVYISALNWWVLWKESREDALHSEARVLSIAVRPAYQGRRIATRLLELGLDYIRSHGEERVRLEARPENHAAVHLYQKMGFEIRGTTRDTQGEWLIMIKDFAC